MQWKEAMFPLLSHRSYSRKDRKWAQRYGSLLIAFADWQRYRVKRFRGYDIHWQGGSSSSASLAAADTQPTHSCSDVSGLNESHTLTDSLISGNLCWIISEALTPTATAHCSSSTEEIRQLPIQAGKSLQLLNTAANLLSRQICLHLFITTMNPHWTKEYSPIPQEIRAGLCQ